MFDRGEEIRPEMRLRSQFKVLLVFAPPLPAEHKNKYIGKYYPFNNLN